MPFYLRIPLPGPFGYSKRIGGRRRRTGQQAGCLPLALVPVVIFVFGWPMLLPGAWKTLIFAWWALAVAGIIVFRRRQRAAALAEEQETAARREDAFAWWEQEQETRRLAAVAALEEAKQTGWLLLDDGEVPAYHGVTPDGTECHHRHRTWQAAAECTQRRIAAGEGRQS